MIHKGLLLLADMQAEKLKAEVSGLNDMGTRELMKELPKLPMKVEAVLDNYKMVVTDLLDIIHRAEYSIHNVESSIQEVDNILHEEEELTQE